MKLRSMLFTFVLLLAAASAKAWNSAGHRLVAEIVWQQMSPDARRNASELLKHHPHYQEILIAHKPAGVGEDEWAFLTAAVWPDMVRHEWEGKTGEVSFHAPAGATAATVTNMQETPEGSALTVSHDKDGDVVKAPIHPFEIITIRVDYPGGPKS